MTWGNTAPAVIGWCNHVKEARSCRGSPLRRVEAEESFRENLELSVRRTSFIAEVRPKAQKNQKTMTRVHARAHKRR